MKEDIHKLVDSRAKGARGEMLARDWLRQATGLGWERTPGSGALAASKKLKGDIWVPGEKNWFTVEIKNYEEDGFNTGALTHKSSVFNSWLSQAIREAGENGNDFMLMYKWNRSPWFIAFPHALMADKLPSSRYIDYENSDFPKVRIYVADDIKSSLKAEYFIK